MNGKELIFGETIFHLRDSNDIFDDSAALQDRMAKDGYLLIRDFYDRRTVLETRREILGFMDNESMLKLGTSIEDGVIGSDNRGISFPHEVVQQFPRFLSLVNSQQIMMLFERFLGGSILSLDHKWLRATPSGQNTSAHCDIVYMGAGTKNLYTVWTAWGDVSLDMGSLAVCLGSHKHQKLINTYGVSDAHQDLLEGWFSRDAYEVVETLGIKWASTEFGAGDIIIFGMYLMHGSLDNNSEFYRVSSDNRYQLALEPVDWRHMGSTPDQIPKKENRITMQEARIKWQI